MDEKIKNVIKNLFLLSVFAASFGYVEGAAAHYLRINFYPGGFADSLTLTAIDTHTLWVELGREFTTIVMLAAVAFLSGGSGLRKFSNFVFIFGIWDIFYYIALHIFEKWPASFLSWDVLFLIPVPWFGPVLVPAALSLLGIVFAVTVNIAEEYKGKAAADRYVVIAVTAGLVLSLISFVTDSPAESFPEYYHWELFILSLAAIITGYVRFLKINFFCDKRETNTLP